MIQHVWTAICHDSSVDRDSSNITLFRVFGHMRISLPRPSENPQAKGVIVPTTFQIVTCWGRSTIEEAANGMARTLFVDPTGDELLSQEYRVDLTYSRQHHQRIGISELPLTEGGRYNVRVDRKTEDGPWETVATSPLDIDLRWTDSEANPGDGGQDI